MGWLGWVGVVRDNVVCNACRVVVVSAVVLCLFCVGRNTVVGKFNNNAT